MIDKETQKHLLAGQPVGANLKRNTNVNINELGKNEIPNIEDVLRGKISKIPDKLESINKIKHLLLYPDTNYLLLEYIYLNLQ